MPKNVQIRLGHTDSVNSVDRQNFLDVELKNTSKLIHFTDIKRTIDQYEQFKIERSGCNRYRLIATINPYCTNVLFNTFTEMVYAEGSDKCEAIVNDTDKPTGANIPRVYRSKIPDRIDMVMNTEYSRPGCAEDSEDKNEVKITDEYYDYHPGFDIFDNHILRNKSFNVVNFTNGVSGFRMGDDLFNTIGDRQRYFDGAEVEYKRRESLDKQVKSKLKRHLYDHDEILEFRNGDAINANLKEENGWYGFINASTIANGIGCVLNDKKPCEFVDMYPDRTLYSFNPKHNKYRHREEYNWEVILTYPYEKTNEYPVADNITVVVGKDKDNAEITAVRNGLIILSAKRTIGPNGEQIILFRSMTKHGLKRGDTVRFYHTKAGDNDKWYQYDKDFKVKNVGDLDNNEKEYYFYINDLDFIRSLNDDGKPDEELEVDESLKYRFARVVGNVASTYYVRKFRKLPNFKYAKRNFPSDGSMSINDYIDENAKEGGKMVLYDKELYKLGFESTIYSDDSTQITFTDTIDIDNLVDARGYPVTEIYVTVIKTNYGHNLWYGDSPDRTDESVEFSHCFGEVSEGLEFSQKKGDLSSNPEIGSTRQSCGDVCMLYKGSSPYGKDITVNNDLFLGDIVEFNPNECIEKPLQSFMHRFNTAQRELELGTADGTPFTYHDIWSDDWDASPTNTDNTVNVDGGIFSIKTWQEYGMGKNRPEGYYYKPHYRIQLREFGEIVQDQHYDINIKTITPVQADGIYLKITTLRGSGVSKGDIIYLFDDKNDKRYEFVVTYIENKASFYVIPYVQKPYETGISSPWTEFTNQSNMNWLDVCNLSVPNDEREALLVFRRKNETIPSYAERVGRNKYLWRKILSVGDSDAKTLPEYAYANNAFYITNEINFFLKRQDPQGWNNLYCKDGFPNDIPGNIKEESNYNYKDESEIVC